MPDSGRRSVGHKRNREEICSASGNLCHGETPDGCASFNRKPVSFDTPCFKNLDSEDLLQSFEKICTDVTECRNLWNNKFKSPEKMMLLPHDIVKRLDSMENMISSVISECKKDYAQFINKPLTLDFPCVFNLGVSKDLRQSLEKTSRAVADGKECANFVSMPVSLDFPCVFSLGVSEDLRQSLEKTSRAVADGKECANFISKPVSLDFPCFENLEVSEDLRRSLEKISSAEVECTNLWNNKISSSVKMAPLFEFQKLLESHGLLWHKNILFENGVTASQLQSRINQRPYDF
ncbi:uncharacterized protein LOC113331155 [Papaver somniferum]|uniref:uncharacterized protein LOC113331155 n=1 Tax=Papaver somniferum TaxID=3469 RepID=UPI000E6FB9DB|nr:uncharacterized protein LOC113331155 [Papaver somniferum]XP_026433694.1 uncharacterized protein LOC113331155 [Papaver somniferum]